ncbi:tRNA (adenosine(37)-N6)-dimethylallyltransferase MiaA [Spiroplasma eriocheiris]|uniref:tRNA dimethylallyltransferase n=1 Tax=Spiroplasma eriocheiris TaxID=315358 RepID=A0A0H3XL68_9MOLU|nr:tRNA (adenosine(37)-N6)-dimethylallyltransferase MiaA [Spiroplasma eriocheiris]AHF57764.1 putative tRNA isopentenyltransferase [Spiroplasma eriocheiris CCTCC M 207170]AKM54214.1 tRNA delta(2)-isopentenylpyrophosphate transferase [Spiroplasma eriocheiris]
MNKPIILIVGPTASGKTDLSIMLAKKINGECINADATQIFNGLDIATNKILPSEQENIPHHLLSTLDLNDNYSISDFQRAGRKIINEIWQRHKIPIVVGGSGLYINALLKDYHFDDHQRDPQFAQQYEKYSNLALWKLLQSTDPEEAKRTHFNNRKRVLRALQYFQENKTLKSVNDDAKDRWYYEPYIIGLNPVKTELHERITTRVAKLTARGLFAEVAAAYEYCHFDETKQSMKIIGCKEIIAYLKGEITYQQAIDQMVYANKIYAKKQLTWFRNQLPTTNWYTFSYQDFLIVANQIINDLEASNYLSSQ